MGWITEAFCDKCGHIIKRNLRGHLSWKTVSTDHPKEFRYYETIALLSADDCCPVCGHLTPDWLVRSVEEK